jgi:DNA polymerase-3 subunit chi
MTEVDFYILDQEDPGERPAFACRLVDKAFRQGHRVYVHTDDETQARQLDDMLWSFRPQSFVPHGLLGSEDAERVAIGWGSDPADHDDVMVNLGLSVPDFVGRFHRVAEVVVQANGIREPLRESFRFYKDRGYPLNNHRL